MFLNIEIKCPYDPEIKKLYDLKSAATKVLELIEEHDYSQHSYVSSFHADFLDELISQSESIGYPVRTVLIGTWYEHDEAPSIEYL